MVFISCGQEALMVKAVSLETCCCVIHRHHFLWKKSHDPSNGPFRSVRGNPALTFWFDLMDLITSFMRPFIFIASGRVSESSNGMIPWVRRTYITDLSSSHTEEVGYNFTERSGSTLYWNIKAFINCHMSHEHWQQTEKKKKNSQNKKQATTIFIRNCGEL